MKKDFQKEILNKLLKDENITDISFNGKDIFIQDNIRGRYKLENSFDIDSIQNYIKQLTNKNRTI